MIHGADLVSLIIKRDDGELPSELNSRRIQFTKTPRTAKSTYTARRFSDRCFYVTWYAHTEPDDVALQGAFRSLDETTSLTRDLARSGPTKGIQWMHITPTESESHGHPMKEMHLKVLAELWKAHRIAAQLKKDPVSFWGLKSFSKSDRTSGSSKGTQEVTDCHSWLNSQGEEALEETKEDPGLSVESSALHYKPPSGHTSRDDPLEHTSTEAGDEQEWSDDTDAETKSTS